MPHQYNEEDAIDLVLQAGQLSLNDADILHDSEANTFAKARRGMTLRLMPTTSVFDRDRAREMHETMGIADHSHRTLYLMRDIDRSRGNDSRISM